MMTHHLTGLCKIPSQVTVKITRNLLVIRIPKKIPLWYLKLENTECSSSNAVNTDINEGNLIAARPTSPEQSRIVDNDCMSNGSQSPDILDTATLNWDHAETASPTTLKESCIHAILHSCEPTMPSELTTVVR